MLKSVTVIKLMRTLSKVGAVKQGKTRRESSETKGKKMRDKLGRHGKYVTFIPSMRITHIKKKGCLYLLS